MELLIQLGFIGLLLLIGLVFGRIAEKRHYRDIVRREAELADVMVFNERTPPADRNVREATLVVGSVVIGEDYFKRIAAALKGLVGGRLTAYESLMDRGRREAVLRMKEAARVRGAHSVFNVRFETASLSEAQAGARPMFSAEFMAYGTALVDWDGTHFHIAVSYENPQVPHEVNVSRESVLAEFLRLAIGLALAVLAVAAVFEVLTDYAGAPRNKAPTLLSTHPADEDRIARLKSAAREWDPARQPLRPVRVGAGRP